MRTVTRMIALAALVAVNVGCTGGVHHAVAMMRPTQGNSVTGVVELVQRGDEVVVTADLQGLTPHGRHAIHIHQFGDTRDPSGKSAGGHYNPDGHDHALPDESKRHAGDLGNLTADARGFASYRNIVDNISLDGFHNPVLGRAVIIHAKADDGGQPTGNAGSRIGVGVIGIAKTD